METQSPNISDDNCSQQEYYQRDIRVVCKCGKWGYETRNNLTNTGWSFGLATICPDCQQSINAICDICGNDASGKKHELVKRGWSFPRGSQICGGHE